MGHQQIVVNAQVFIETSQIFVIVSPDTMITEFLYVLNVYILVKIVVVLVFVFLV